VSTRISYGKLSVPVQCVGVGPGLLALDVSVEVLGQRFLAAYTEGDNRAVVATDTMKNVILRHALEYDGATPEGFLHTLGTRFLGTYPEMEGLRLGAHVQPFAPAPIDGAPSDRLFVLGGPDHGVAELELGAGAALVAARSGHVGMRLLKTTGSAFVRFARDDATTLPERSDRPLFIALDAHWRYADPADALAEDPARYVAAPQVRDFVAAVFHEFVSESIQHLVHEMGQRLLARFPPLAEIEFRAENHTFDPVPGMDPGADRRAYTSAFPAWGLITLTLTR
jgi:urate oxidase / 2-oxo-4-hydroxy-4-carboxy-5-ureidoimidazoline decarboxylase